MSKVIIEDNEIFGLDVAVTLKKGKIWTVECLLVDGEKKQGDSRTLADLKKVFKEPIDPILNEVIAYTLHRDVSWDITDEN